MARSLALITVFLLLAAIDARVLVKRQSDFPGDLPADDSDIAGQIPSPRASEPLSADKKLIKEVAEFASRAILANSKNGVGSFVKVINAEYIEAFDLTFKLTMEMKGATDDDVRICEAVVFHQRLSNTLLRSVCPYGTSSGLSEGTAPVDRVPQPLRSFPFELHQSKKANYEPITI